MSDAVRALLWETSGIDDLGERDYFDGMLLAAERLGVAWSTDPPVRRADRAAAEAHLERLLAAVRPLSRTPDEEGLRAARRFSGALEALAAAGAVDADAWRTRLLRAEAPWLEEHQVEDVGGRAGFVAIHVPASSPEEEAADAEHEARAERLARRGALRHVAVCRAPARHEGTAVVALVARTASAELLFQHVGPVMPDAPTHDPDRFGERMRALAPPVLLDDMGTAYVPVADHPLASHGGGSPGRPTVSTGHWRYAPAPPDEARTFTARLGGTTWALAPPTLRA